VRSPSLSVPFLPRLVDLGVSSFEQLGDDANVSERPAPHSRARSGIGVSVRIGSGAITEEGDIISTLYVMKPKTPADPFGMSVKI
jgi:hypothetical protein